MKFLGSIDFWVRRLWSFGFRVFNWVGNDCLLVKLVFVGDFYWKFNCGRSVGCVKVYCWFGMSDLSGDWLRKNFLVWNWFGIDGDW